MFLGVFGFCAALSCAGFPAAAQTTHSLLVDSIGVRVGPSTPTNPDSSPIVRRPYASYLFPSTAMPRKIAARSTELSMEVYANVTLSATGNLETCHADPAVSQWQPSSDHRTVTDIALGTQVCLLVARYATFHPVLYENGETGAAKAKVTVYLRHSNFQNPPMLAPAPTSGGVLDVTGQRGIFDNYWGDKLVITPPEWDKAFPDRAKMSSSVRVGVLLSVHTKDGISHAEGCKLAMPSGNANVDAATCTALMSTAYSYGSAAVQNLNVEDIPVIVTWRADSVSMNTAPKISVPHMPTDVALAPGDVPAVAPPTYGQVRIAIRLGVDGQVTDCTITRSSGSDSYDAASCRIAHARARFTIARDSFGNATLGTYDAVVDWDKMAIRPSRP